MPIKPENQGRTCQRCPNPLPSGSRSDRRWCDQCQSDRHRERGRIRKRREKEWLDAIDAPRCMGCGKRIANATDDQHTHDYPRCIALAQAKEKRSEPSPEESARIAEICSMLLYRPASLPAAPPRFYGGLLR